MPSRSQGESIERIPEWLERMHSIDESEALLATIQLRKVGEVALPFLVGRLRCRLSGRWPKLAEAMVWTDGSAGWLAAQCADIASQRQFSAHVAAELLGRLGPAADPYRVWLVRVDNQAKHTRRGRSANLVRRFEAARTKEWVAPPKPEGDLKIEPLAEVAWPGHWNGAPVAHLLSAHAKGTLPSAVMELWELSDPDRNPERTGAQHRRLGQLRQAARALAASVPRLPAEALLALDPVARRREIARTAISVHPSDDAKLLSALERAAADDPVARAWVRLARLAHVEWSPQPQATDARVHELGMKLTDAQRMDPQFVRVQRAIAAADRLGRWSFETKLHQKLGKDGFDGGFTMQQLACRTDWSAATLDAVAELVLVAPDGPTLRAGVKVLARGGAVGARHLNSIDFDDLPQSRAMAFLGAGCNQSGLLRYVLVSAAGDVSPQRRHTIREALRNGDAAARIAAIAQLLAANPDGGRIAIALDRVWPWDRRRPKDRDPSASLAAWVEPIGSLLARDTTTSPGVRAGLNVLARCGRAGARRLARELRLDNPRFEAALDAARHVSVAGHAELADPLLAALPSCDLATLPKLVRALEMTARVAGHANVGWQRRLLSQVGAVWPDAEVDRRDLLAVAVCGATPLLTKASFSRVERAEWIARLGPILADEPRAKRVAAAFDDDRRFHPVGKVGALVLRMEPSRAETLAYWRARLAVDRPVTERSIAIRTLGPAGAAAAGLLPEVMVALRDQHLQVRWAAIRTIEAMGSAAAPALPVLQELAKGDPHSGVRQQAKRVAEAVAARTAK